MSTRLDRALDRLGLDHVDIDTLSTLAMAHAHRKGVDHNAAGASRYWFHSPCWAIHDVDFHVHVVLPALIATHHPDAARRLRSTSPRWSDLPLTVIAA